MQGKKNISALIQSLLKSIVAQSKLNLTSSVTHIDETNDPKTSSKTKTMDMDVP